MFFLNESIYVNHPLLIHFEIGLSIDLVMMVYGLDLYIFDVMIAIYVHGEKNLIHGMNPYLNSRFGLTYSKTKIPSQTTTS